MEEKIMPDHEGAVQNIEPPLQQNEQAVPPQMEGNASGTYQEAPQMEYGAPGVQNHTPIPPQMGYGGPGTQSGSGVPPQMGYGGPGMQGGSGVPPQMGYGGPGMQGGSGVPPQMPPYGYRSQPSGEGAGLAIASMVLGIISIVACLWFYVTLPCAIVGMVLGCVYRGRGGRNGMSIAGIVCSAVGIAISLFIIGCLVFTAIIVP